MLGVCLILVCVSKSICPIVLVQNFLKSILAACIACKNNWRAGATSHRYQHGLKSGNNSSLSSRSNLQNFGNRYANVCQTLV